MSTQGRKLPLTPNSRRRATAIAKSREMEARGLHPVIVPKPSIAAIKPAKPAIAAKPAKPATEPKPEIQLPNGPEPGEFDVNSLSKYVIKQSITTMVNVTEYNRKPATVANGDNFKMDVFRQPRAEAPGKVKKLRSKIKRNVNGTRQHWRNYQRPPIISHNDQNDSTSSFDSTGSSEETVSDSWSPHGGKLGIVSGVYRKLDEVSTGGHTTTSKSPASSYHIVETLLINRLPGEKLGMILRIEGGKNTPGPVHGVFVRSVTSGGAAERASGSNRGMCIGDKILEVNSVKLQTMMHSDCISIFREMPLQVTLVVKRAGVKSAASPAPHLTPEVLSNVQNIVAQGDCGKDSGGLPPEGYDLLEVVVVKDISEPLGLSIVPSYGSTKDCYQIKRLLPSGACCRHGQLMVGDRLLSCNGQLLRGVTQCQCMQALKHPTHRVVLHVLRPQHKGSFKISVTKSRGRQIPGYSHDSDNEDSCTSPSVTPSNSPEPKQKVSSNTDELSDDVDDNDNVSNIDVDEINAFSPHPPVNAVFAQSDVILTYSSQTMNRMESSINNNLNFSTLSKESAFGNILELYDATDSRNSCSDMNGPGVTPDASSASTFKSASPNLADQTFNSSVINPQQNGHNDSCTDSLITEKDDRSVDMDSTLDSCNSSFDTTMSTDKQNSCIPPPHQFADLRSMERNDNNGQTTAGHIPVTNIDDILDDIAEVPTELESGETSDDCNVQMQQNTCWNGKDATGSVHTGADRRLLNNNSSEVGSSERHSQELIAEKNNGVHSEKEVGMNDVDSMWQISQLRDFLTEPDGQDDAIIAQPNSHVAGSLDEDSTLATSTKSALSPKWRSNQDGIDLLVDFMQEYDTPQIVPDTYLDKRCNGSDRLLDIVDSASSGRPDGQHQNAIEFESEIFINLSRHNDEVQRYSDAYMFMETDSLVDEVIEEEREEDLIDENSERNDNKTEVSLTENVQNTQDNSYDKETVIECVSSPEHVISHTICSSSDLIDTDVSVSENVVDIVDHGSVVATTNISQALSSQTFMPELDKSENRINNKEYMVDSPENDAPSTVERVDTDKDVIVFENKVEYHENNTNASVVGDDKSLDNKINNVSDDSHDEILIDRCSPEMIVPSISVEPVIEQVNTITMDLASSDSHSQVLNLTQEFEVESPGDLTQMTKTSCVENSEVVADVKSGHTDRIEEKGLVKIDTTRLKSEQLDKKLLTVDVGSHSQSAVTMSVPKITPTSKKRLPLLKALSPRGFSLTNMSPSPNASPLNTAGKKYSPQLTVSSPMSSPSLSPFNRLNLQTLTPPRYSVVAVQARSETGPFQVEVLKGILGLGIKVAVHDRGVTVTEILKSSPIEKNANIRVGDYILSINSTDLTSLHDSKVQQILRLLPRGLVRVIASAVPPADLPSDIYTDGQQVSSGSSVTPVLSPSATTTVVMRPKKIAPSYCARFSTGAIRSTQSSTGSDGGGSDAHYITTIPVSQRPVSMLETNTSVIDVVHSEENVSCSDQHPSRMNQSTILSNKGPCSESVTRGTSPHASSVNVITVNTALFPASAPVIRPPRRKDNPLLISSSCEKGDKDLTDGDNKCLPVVLKDANDNTIEANNYTMNNIIENEMISDVKPVEHVLNSTDVLGIKDSETKSSPPKVCPKPMHMHTNSPERQVIKPDHTEPLQNGNIEPVESVSPQSVQHKYSYKRVSQRAEFFKSQMQLDNEEKKGELTIVVSPPSVNTKSIKAHGKVESSASQMNDVSSQESQKVLAGKLEDVLSQAVQGVSLTEISHKPEQTEVTAEKLKLGKHAHSQNLCDNHGKTENENLSRFNFPDSPISEQLPEVGSTILQKHDIEPSECIVHDVTPALPSKQGTSSDDGDLESLTPPSLPKSPPPPIAPKPKSLSREASFERANGPLVIKNFDDLDFSPTYNPVVSSLSRESTFEMQQNVPLIETKYEMKLSSTATPEKPASLSRESTFEMQQDAPIIVMKDEMKLSPTVTPAKSASLSRESIFEMQQNVQINEMKDEMKLSPPASPQKPASFSRESTFEMQQIAPMIETKHNMKFSPPTTPEKSALLPQEPTFKMHQNLTIIEAKNEMKHSPPVIPDKPTSLSREATFEIQQITSSIEGNPMLVMHSEDVKLLSEEPSAKRWHESPGREADMRKTPPPTAKKPKPMSRETCFENNKTWPTSEPLFHVKQIPVTKSSERPSSYSETSYKPVLRDTALEQMRPQSFHEMSPHSALDGGMVKLRHSRLTKTNSDTLVSRSRASWHGSPDSNSSFSPRVSPTKSMLNSNLSPTAWPHHSESPKLRGLQIPSKLATSLGSEEHIDQLDSPLSRNRLPRLGLSSIKISPSLQPRTGPKPFSPPTLFSKSPIFTPKLNLSPIKFNPQRSDYRHDRPSTSQDSGENVSPSFVVSQSVIKAETPSIVSPSAMYTDSVLFNVVSQISTSGGVVGAPISSVKMPNDETFLEMSTPSDKSFETATNLSREVGRPTDIRLPSTSPMTFSSKRMLSPIHNMSQSNSTSLLLTGTSESIIPDILEHTVADRPQKSKTREAGPKISVSSLASLSSQVINSDPVIIERSTAHQLTSEPSFNVTEDYNKDGKVTARQPAITEEITSIKPLMNKVVSDTTLDHEHVGEDNYVEINTEVNQFVPQGDLLGIHELQPEFRSEASTIYKQPRHKSAETSSNVADIIKPVSHVLTEDNEESVAKTFVIQTDEDHALVSEQILRPSSIETESISQERRLNTIDQSSNSSPWMVTEAEGETLSKDEYTTQQQLELSDLLINVDSSSSSVEAPEVYEWKAIIAHPEVEFSARDSDSTSAPIKHITITEVPLSPIKKTMIEGFPTFQSSPQLKQEVESNVDLSQHQLISSTSTHDAFKPESQSDRIEVAETPCQVSVSSHRLSPPVHESMQHSLLDVSIKSNSCDSHVNVNAPVLVSESPSDDKCCNLLDLDVPSEAPKSPMFNVAPSLVTPPLVSQKDITDSDISPVHGRNCADKALILPEKHSHIFDVNSLMFPDQVGGISGPVSLKDVPCSSPHNSEAHYDDINVENVSDDQGLCALNIVHDHFSDQDQLPVVNDKLMAPLFYQETLATSTPRRPEPKIHPSDMHLTHNTQTTHDQHGINRHVQQDILISMEETADLCNDSERRNEDKYVVNNENAGRHTDTWHYLDESDIDGPLETKLTETISLYSSEDPDALLDPSSHNSQRIYDDVFIETSNLSDYDDVSFEVNSMSLIDVSSNTNNNNNNNTTILSSKRRWSLLSPQNSSSFLMGTAQSSVSLHELDGSILAPKELTSLIDAANESLDEFLVLEGATQRPLEQILVSVLHKEPGEKMGLTLGFGPAGDILITNVDREGLAAKDSGLQDGDRLLSVNGKSVKGRTPTEVRSVLRVAQEQIVIVASRPEFGTRTPSPVKKHDKIEVMDRAPHKLHTSDGPETFEVILHKSFTGLGFCLEGGFNSPLGDRPITVKRIFKGGAAEKCGLLKVGDEIRQANGEDFRGMRHFEAWNYLKYLPDGPLILTIRR